MISEHAIENTTRGCCSQVPHKAQIVHRPDLTPHRHAGRFYMTTTSRQAAVLIVDSNADARECLRDLLEVEGFSTMAAPPGREAEILLEQSDVPCIVLLGILGQGRTGLEQIAILEHESFILEAALSVFDNIDEIADDGSAQGASSTRETVAERQLFQRAMCQRKRIGRLAESHRSGDSDWAALSA